MRGEQIDVTRDEAESFRIGDRLLLKRPGQDMVFREYRVSKKEIGLRDRKGVSPDDVDAKIHIVSEGAWDETIDSSSTPGDSE